MRQKFPDVKKVRYVGMDETGEELRSNGLETCGGTGGDPQFEKPGCYFNYEEIAKYPFDKDVGAVICGIDFKISYSKIALASMYIQRGAKFIVTNDDAYTMQSGYRAPGNGVCIAAIEKSLVGPGGKGLICDKIVTGKPNPEIIDLIRGQHGIPESDLSKMLMIGDRADTDIALGNNAGIDSCLVLSGVVQSEEEAKSWGERDELYRPTYVLGSFGEDILMTPEELANL